MQGEVGVEMRLIVAYALIAIMVVTAATWGLVARRRRAARKLRLRGIKVNGG